MKRIFVLFTFAAILSAVSCQQEEIREDESTEGLVELVFDAVISEEQSQTKTVLGGTSETAVRNILWQKNDAVAIYGFGTDKPREFVNESDSESWAKFKGYVAPADGYAAFYPYDKNVSVVGDNFAFSLPYEQTYVKDNFASGSFPMVAKQVEDNLSFMNLCGILELNLIGTGIVESISFYATDADGNVMPVAGKAQVSYGYSDAPSIVMGGDTGKVTLDCGEGVKLSESKAIPFHIVLPPAQYDNFDLVICYAGGKSMSKSGTKPLVIRRSERTKTAALRCDGPVDVPIDLSSDGTANCYIVSDYGNYMFKAVKGNSNDSVGEVASVEVLWESFGTSETPTVGSLVRNASYSEGYVHFATASTYKEGNAVIAAKNASGKILWSWHIWLTDQPEEQVYYNGASPMMDRNLGATSATPGDAGALGLIYQWGRKDPFLASYQINNNILAKSTASWPYAKVSSQSLGTISWAYENPMVYIVGNELNEDWLYTGSDEVDNTRWQANKTEYDPCPPGWRIPTGGRDGIWYNAGFDECVFDSNHCGTNMNVMSGSTWYPAVGAYGVFDGELNDVGNDGYYWAVASSLSAQEYDFMFHRSKAPHVTSYTGRKAYGHSVRCMKESSSDASGSDGSCANLSLKGTANSYIVSASGNYKFNTVKGNSFQSVGNVASAEVLWESFGTSVQPSVGDLVRNVSYANGYIQFSTPSNFKEGNAVIAAKDSSGKILWSWHIWLTDQPAEHVYYNNAGVVMDRNLGAISATPGDVGSLGLLYQWGRKDPFLGSASINSRVEPAATGKWTCIGESTGQIGTIQYSIENPMTFLYNTQLNEDWYYTGSTSVDNSRWQATKTIYDPCPAGWTVPVDEVWYNALTSNPVTFDTTNRGINLSGVYGDDSVIWYPAAGNRGPGGELYEVGYNSFYWSSTPCNVEKYINTLYFSENQYQFNTILGACRVFGTSVRCVKE